MTVLKRHDGTNWIPIQGANAINGTISSNISISGGNNVTISNTSGTIVVHGKTDFPYLNSSLSYASVNHSHSVVVQGNIQATQGAGTYTLSVPNQTAFVLSASNGIAFGTNGSTVTASYTVPNVPAQTVQPAVGQLNGSSGTMTVSGGSNITISNTGSTILIQGKTDFPYLGSASSYATSNHSHSISVPNGTVNGSQFTLTHAGAVNIATVAGGSIQISAPTQTAYQFSASNGIAFGTNGSTVTASYTVPNVPAQTQQPMYFSVSNSNTSANTLVFGNTNNVSFSYSNGSLVGSASFPAQTAEPRVISLNGTSGAMSISALGALGLTTNGGTISLSVPAQTAYQFSASNGIAFGTNGSTVTASYTVPSVPAQTNQGITLNAVGNSTQVSSLATTLNALTFEGAGAASVGFSNNRVLISVPVGGGGNTATISGSNGSYASNGISVVGSGAAQVYTTAGSSLVVSVPNVVAQTVQTGNINAVGNTVGTANSSYELSQLNFKATGNISIGNSGGSILFSVPVGGGAGDGWNQINAGGSTFDSTQAISFGNRAGVSFITSNGSIAISEEPHIYATGWSLNGNTAGTNSTGWTAEDKIYLQGGNNITLSGNSNTIVFSVNKLRLSQYEPYPMIGTSVSSLGQSTILIQPWMLQNDISISRLNLPMVMSSSSSGSASSYQAGFTWNVGLYTRNATNSSRLDTIWSSQITSAFAISSNVNVAVSFTGGNTVSAGIVAMIAFNSGRIQTVAMPLSLSAGEYFFAMNQISSGNTMAMRYNNLVLTNNTNSNAGWGYVNQAVTNTLNPRIQGFGQFSVQSASLPNSIGLNEIRHSRGEVVYCNVVNYATA